MGPSVCLSICLSCLSVCLPVSLSVVCVSVAFHSTLPTLSLTLPCPWAATLTSARLLLMFCGWLNGRCAMLEVFVETLCPRTDTLHKALVLLQVNIYPRWVHLWRSCLVIGLSLWPLPWTISSLPHSVVSSPSLLTGRLSSPSSACPWLKVASACLDNPLKHTLILSQGLLPSSLFVLVHRSLTITMWLFSSPSRPSLPRLPWTPSFTRAPSAPPLGASAKPSELVSALTCVRNVLGYSLHLINCPPPPRTILPQSFQFCWALTW